MFKAHRDVSFYDVTSSQHKMKRHDAHMKVESCVFSYTTLSIVSYVTSESWRVISTCDIVIPLCIQWPDNPLLSKASAHLSRRFFIKFPLYGLWYSILCNKQCKILVDFVWTQDLMVNRRGIEMGIKPRRGTMVVGKKKARNIWCMSAIWNYYITWNCETQFALKLSRFRAILFKSAAAWSTNKYRLLFILRTSWTLIVRFHLIKASKCTITYIMF